MVLLLYSLPLFSIKFDNLYMNRTRQLMAELLAGGPLLSHLIRQQMTLRYRRTFLGYLWTLVNPLMMILIMGIVFSSLFKQDLFQFTAFLFAGMIPWNFINGVVSQSGSAYISNEGLIKKIYIPKIILPLSIVATLFLDAILSFAVLLFLIIILGGKVSWVIFFVPIALFFLLIFAVGVSLIVAITNVFYRDLQYILTILMQGIFYLTPVLYVKDTIPNSLAILVSLNPLTPLIDMFRIPISYRVMPEYHIIFLAVIISFGTLAFGGWIFLRQEKKIIFRI